MATCLEYNDERTQTCDQWEDQGYNDCSSWNPWFAWICIGWTWVSHVVCVGYTWTTTAVCVVWDTTVTVVDAIGVTLEGIGLGWLLNLVAAAIGFIFVIPVIGPIIQWIWNVGLTIVSAILSIPDIVGYTVGIRPQKKLRVCAIILVDSKGNPVAANADVVNALNTAIAIYFREMNVVIIRSAPFQYSTGFIHPPPADKSWITQRQLGDDQLIACCDACMAGEDLWLKGSSKKIEIMQDCFWGNWRRIVGIGAPVAIFVVQSMESRTVTLSDGSTTTSQTIGCGLGPLTDFVVIAQSAPALFNPNALQSSPETTAHELGHICTLWHLTGASDVTNLMFANENGLVDASGAPLARIDTNLFLDGRPSWSAHPDTSAISEERVMTTELFGRKPSAGAELAKQFDWQARKIRGVYFPDLDKLPIADKAARQEQIRKIAGDCGCGFAAVVAVIVTAAYGAALGLSAIAVSASPFWNYASVAGVFVAAAIAGKLMSQARNHKRLRSLRDEIKLETIDTLVRMQGRQT